MSWGSLFDRAAAHGASEEDVRAALARRRSEGESTDGAEGDDAGA